MKKICIAIILVILIISIVLIINNINESKLKNKLIEYCNTIYTELNEEGEFELTLKDIETIYNFNIQPFKKYSKEKTKVTAIIKDNKITCKPKLEK